MVTPRGAFPTGGIDGRDRARFLPPDAAPYLVRRAPRARGSRQRRRGRPPRWPPASCRG